jgi:hypothetical protein
LQTLAQSLALVPDGPTENTTLAPFSMVTPQTGQTSLVNSGMSIYSYSWIV